MIDIAEEVGTEIYEFFKNKQIKRGAASNLYRNILIALDYDVEETEENVELLYQKMKKTVTFTRISITPTAHAKKRARERDCRIPDAIDIAALPNGLEGITDNWEQVKIKYSNNYDLVLVVGDYDPEGPRAMVKTVFLQRRTAPAKLRNKKARRVLSTGKIVKRRKRS